MDAEFGIKHTGDIEKLDPDNHQLLSRWGRNKLLITVDESAFICRSIMGKTASCAAEYFRSVTAIEPL